MSHRTNDNPAAPDTRRRLMDAAEALFDQKGFRETSVREIAERAEVSVGLIYHYFRSKQDILASIYDEKIRSLLDALQESPQLTTHTDGLREAMVIMTGQLVQLPFAQICQAISPTNGHMIPGPKLVRLLEEAAADAQKNRELTDRCSPQELVRDMITAALGVILRWCDEGGTYDVVAEQRRFMRAFLHGLRPD